VAGKGGGERRQKACGEDSGWVAPVQETGPILTAWAFKALAWMHFREVVNGVQQKTDPV
jgi:hypothetical protein